MEERHCLGKTPRNEDRVSRRRIPDIVYFRTSIPAESGEGAIGWSIVVEVKQALESRGATVGRPRAWYDGLRFSCRVSRREFDIELTPYFEVQPMQWSLAFHPVGILRWFPPAWHESSRQLHAILTAIFEADPRFSVLAWESIAALARRRH